MIHSRGANGSDVEIVWSQLLQGMGGRLTVVSMQVSAEASVPHVDLAMVITVVYLITDIGGAIGNAAGGSSSKPDYSIVMRLIHASQLAQFGLTLCLRGWPSICPSWMTMLERRCLDRSPTQRLILVEILSERASLWVRITSSSLERCN
jgi:hypothetical protein